MFKGFDELKKMAELTEYDKFRFGAIKEKEGENFFVEKLNMLEREQDVYVKKTTEIHLELTKLKKSLYFIGAEINSSMGNDLNGAIERANMLNKISERTDYLCKLNNFYSKALDNINMEMVKIANYMELLRG